MERAALPGRLSWQFGRVVATIDETPHTRSLILDMPGWRGSGVVPLMAMLRHRAAQRAMVPARLLYSARDAESRVYQHELAGLAADDPTLMVAYTLTRHQPEGWHGYRRRIDHAMLCEVAWLPAERPLAFVCGPTTLVESVATALVELGHNPGCVRTERFGPGGAA